MHLEMRQWGNRRQISTDMFFTQAAQNCWLISGQRFVNMQLHGAHPIRQTLQNSLGVRPRIFTSIYAYIY
jgi:hypothetical protein